MTMTMTMTRQIACASFGALLLLNARPSLAAAETDRYQRNWPQWRGPAANGLVLHGDPPLEWSEEQNVRWKVAIPGQGHATPIIWEKQIFILTAVPEPAATASTGPRILAGQAAPPGGGEPRRRGGGSGPAQEPSAGPFILRIPCNLHQFRTLPGCGALG